MQATTDGYIDKSEMLPGLWLKKEICFMTGTPIDLDHDDTDEILLGGWGTVFLLKEDFNQDGFVDIVALTHDFGFHQGFVQVLYFNSSLKRFEEKEVINWPKITLKLSQHYLHRALAFDIDKDGKKDIIGQINYVKGSYFFSPKLFILLNKGNFFEYQSSNFLKIKKENYISGMDILKLNYKNEDSLIISYYNGNVDIF